MTGETGTLKFGEAVHDVCIVLECLAPGKRSEWLPFPSNGMMERGSYGFVETAVRSGTIAISSTFFTLFVYGTLMRGGVRHHVLAGQRFLGEARTHPEFALLDLGAYPGLVRREEGGRAVFGELYEVAASLIERLDRIEGAPSLFRLEPVLIQGHVGDVFTYIYQQDARACSLCAEDRWTNDRTRQ
jgi:gamma-glutamylcyclotransferase (GGCT)/AIG2-like uncharacterized protein YtfP